MTRFFILSHQLLRPSVQVLQEWRAKTYPFKVPADLEMCEAPERGNVELTVWELAVQIFEGYGTNLIQ